MKEIINALDFIIDAVRKGDNALAGVLLLVLRAKLISEAEHDKVKREAGRELSRDKKKMIASIKKLKII